MVTDIIFFLLIYEKETILLIDKIKSLTIKKCIINMKCIINIMKEKGTLSNSRLKRSIMNICKWNHITND